MDRAIVIDGRIYRYQLDLKDSYLGWKMRVLANGLVVLSWPSSQDYTAAEQLLRRKAAWIRKRLRQLRNRKILAVLPAGDWKNHCKAAAELARQRLEFFNQTYGLAYKKVVIKNQKTRWGSCSRSGILNFNYKIIFLPAELSDYIIVHELCHLRELNHSKRFWKLVGQSVPKYQTLRRELVKILLVRSV